MKVKRGQVEWHCRLQAMSLRRRAAGEPAHHSRPDRGKRIDGEWMVLAARLFEPFGAQHAPSLSEIADALNRLLLKGLVQGAW
jgi:hypothetical protein